MQGTAPKSAVGTVSVLMRPPREKYSKAADTGDATALDIAAGRRTLWAMAANTTTDPFDVRVVPAATLSPDDRETIIQLFVANYRDGNIAYLEASFSKLKHAAIATAGGRTAGFALGELRVIDLPRLGPQPVAMAGISCIDPAFRRRGLFGLLLRRAMGVGIEGPAPARILSCGRMAHPVSFRTMLANPTAIPRRGIAPTPWQQEIGRAIAQAYGSPGFDPETFVCKGSGAPIGYPVLDLEVTPEEWEVFRPVDRDRGDSLLGMAWQPDAPDGW
jgi:hypothetical protein